MWETSFSSWTHDGTLHRLHDKALRLSLCLCLQVNVSWECMWEWDLLYCSCFKWRTENMQSDKGKAAAALCCLLSSVSCQMLVSVDLSWDFRWLFNPVRIFLSCVIFTFMYTTGSKLFSVTSKSFDLSGKDALLSITVLFDITTGWHQSTTHSVFKPALINFLWIIESKDFVM